MSELNGADWACERCKSGAGGRLDFPPWPGELGRRIQSKICESCWNEWVGIQTRIINEYRLNVLDPGHSRAVREQMEVFLGFRQPDQDAQAL
jgi:Fe-S cluster biosynthesis and repair protein YggX